MRKSITLLAVIASLASLTACSSAGSGNALASPGECAKTVSGKASKAVTVTGDLGTAPQVSFKGGSLKPAATERDIVKEGDGEEVEPGDTTFIEVSMYNGDTGAVFTQTGYGSSPAAAIVVNDKNYMKGLVRAVECTTVGSRVSAVVAASDAFGAAGSADGSVKANQPIVVVVDVLGTVHSDAKADGAPQEPVAGMPSVKLDPAGRPTVKIPGTGAPATLQVAVLKQGDGAVVPADARVVINYQGVNWRTGKIFDESWGKGPSNFLLSKVVPGFTQAIAGQKVGSQIIAVIPADLGYGTTGNADAGIEGTDTIVFVIDILAAASATAPAAG